MTTSRSSSLNGIRMSGQKARGYKTKVWSYKTGYLSDTTKEIKTLAKSIKRGLDSRLKDFSCESDLDLCLSPKRNLSVSGKRAGNFGTMGGEPGSDTEDSDSDLELNQLVLDNAVELGLVQKEKQSVSSTPKSSPKAVKSSRDSKKTKESCKVKLKRTKSADKRPEGPDSKGDNQDTQKAISNERAGSNPSDEFFSMLSPLTSISKLSKQYRKKSALKDEEKIQPQPAAKARRNSESSESADNSSSAESSDLELEVDSNNAESSFVEMDKHSGEYSGKTSVNSFAESSSLAKSVNSRTNTNDPFHKDSVSTTANKFSVPVSPKSPLKSPKSPAKSGQSRQTESSELPLSRSLLAEITSGKSAMGSDDSEDSDKDSSLSSDDSDNSQRCAGHLERDKTEREISHGAEKQQKRNKGHERTLQKSGVSTHSRIGENSSNNDQAMNQKFEADVLKSSNSKKRKDSKTNSSDIHVRESGKGKQKPKPTEKNQKCISEQEYNKNAGKLSEEHDISSSSSDDTDTGVSQSFRAEMLRRQNQQKSSPSGKKPKAGESSKDSQDEITEPFSESVKFAAPEGFQAVEFRGSKASVWYEDMSSEDTELWLVRAPVGLDPKTLGGKTLLLHGVQSLGSLGEGNVTYESQATKDKTQQMKNLQAVMSSKQNKKMCLVPEIRGQLSIVQSILVPPIVIPAVAIPGPKPLPAGLKPRYKPFGSDSPVTTSKSTSMSHKKKKHRNEPSESESSSMLVETPPYYTSHAKKKKKKDKSDAETRLESSSSEIQPAEMHHHHSHTSKKKKHRHRDVPVAEPSSSEIQTREEHQEPSSSEIQTREELHHHSRGSKKKKHRGDSDVPVAEPDSTSQPVESTTDYGHVKKRKKKHKSLTEDGSESNQTAKRQKAEERGHVSEGNDSFGHDGVSHKRIKKRHKESSKEETSYETDVYSEHESTETEAHKKHKKKKKKHKH